MEHKRLEVILEARDRASAALHSFGGNLDKVVQRAQHAALAIGRSFAKIQGAVGAAGGGGALAGIGGALSGALSGALAIASRLGSVFLSVGHTILGVLGSIIGKVAELGRSALRWIGETIVGAVHKATFAVLGLIAAMGAAATALISMSIKSAGALEDNIIRFGVLMGGVAEGMAEIAEVRAMEPFVPFRLDELIEADRLLKVFEIDLGGTTATLKTFADVAAGTGHPLEDVIMAFMRLQAGMFSSRLMAPLGLSMPKMAQAGVKFSSSGKATGEAEGRGDVLSAAALQIWSRYAGLAGKLMEGLGGRLTNLASSWGKLKTAIGVAFVPAAKAAIDALSNILDKIRQFVADNDKLKASIGRVGEFLTGVFAGLGDKIGGWLDWLAENWDTVWTAITDKVAWAAEMIAYGIGAVVGVVQDLWSQKDVIRDWAQTIIDAAFDIGKNLKSYVIDALLSIPRIAGGALGVLGGLLENAAKMVLDYVMTSGSGTPFYKRQARPLGEVVSQGWQRGSQAGSVISQDSGYRDMIMQLDKKWSMEAPKLREALFGPQSFLGKLGDSAEKSAQQYQQSVRDFFGGWGKGAAGGAAGISSLGGGAYQLPEGKALAYAADTARRVDELKAALAEATQAVDDSLNSGNLQAFNDASDRVRMLKDQLASVNTGIEDLDLSVQTASDGLDNLRAAAQEADKAFEDFTDTMKKKSVAEMFADMLGATGDTEGQKAWLAQAAEEAAAVAKENLQVYMEHPESIGALQAASKAAVDAQKAREAAYGSVGGENEMPGWGPAETSNGWDGRGKRQTNVNITVNGNVNDLAEVKAAVDAGVEVWWNEQVSLEVQDAGYQEGY